MGDSAGRSVFVRRAIPFTFEREGDLPIHITVTRVPARHAYEWEAVWDEYKPTLADYSPAQIRDFTVRIVKAAIPEPDPTLACPAVCACSGNAGVHALIDTLGREEIDVLFKAVLDANAPKGPAAPMESAGSASPSTTPSRASSWLASLWRLRSRSRSKRSGR